VEKLQSTCLRPIRRCAAGAITAALISGCAVGPDFRSPPTPTQTGYTAAPLPLQTSASPGKDGVAQRLLLGAEIPAEWWTLFHSLSLNMLIDRAFANSPTLAAAKATLSEARENRRAQLGALFPQIDASLSGERRKISGAAFGQPNGNSPPFNLYNASIDLTYNLDLFGGARRELEALQAQVDFQRFQLKAAYLTLSANVVTAAIREASLRAQLASSREIAELQRQQLSLVEIRFQLGAVSELEVAAQRALLAQTLAALPELEKQLQQNRHLLAVLAGEPPSQAAGVPQFELEALQLPEKLPVSLPSALVRQRPDILAAQALWHAASAQLGVATANLYPQLTLSAGYGSEAVKIGSLFSNSVWNLGAGLVQPLFHGGQLAARRRAAVAAYQQAGEQYRETVLQAFQDVADVLQALDRDAATQQANWEAAQAAGRTLELIREQLRLGAVSYLALLDADRQYQQARLNLIRSQAARYADTAALFHALGGGWWQGGFDHEQP
jgi:NodT family efflux transporter outer membrane factor (OMF) lipoprotein